MEAAAVGIALGAIPGGKLMKLLGDIGHGAMSLAVKYAQKQGAKLLNAVWDFATNGTLTGMVRRGIQWLKRGCGCFTGPTTIWTDRGLVTLADVQVGDLVLAHNDETGELSFREVLKTYVRQGAPIVLVTLMAADPALGNTLTTIETTEEHPFLVEATANGDMPGWTRVDALSPGDTIKQLDGLSPGSVVVAVQFSSRREQVHNLEVEGLRTYLVGADGVVVHNGGLCPWPKPKYGVNEMHLHVKKKTPIPHDAEDVYEKSIWARGAFWGKSSDGKFYRFSHNNRSGTDSEAHFSGSYDNWRTIPKEVVEMLGK